MAFRDEADTTTVAADELRSFITRVERMNEEKAALNADISEIFAEAKARGYDPKIMKIVVKLRKMDANKRQEQDAILDLYLNAVGLE